MTIPRGLYEAALHAACEANDVDVGMVRTWFRHPEYSHTRHGIAKALRGEGFSLTAIGRAMKRDHTTIMNSLAKFEDGSPSLFMLQAYTAAHGAIQDWRAGRIPDPTDDEPAEPEVNETDCEAVDSEPMTPWRFWKHPRPKTPVAPFAYIEHRPMNSGQLATPIYREDV